MYTDNKQKTTTTKAESVTFSNSSRPLVVHKASPDFTINKSDLIIYLKHFRDAVDYKAKQFKIQEFLEILFYWSIFFTATFSSIGFISGNLVKYFLFAVASISTYTKIIDIFSKDNSKYKEIDEEKMADIIEENCTKIKNK
jgi:hypothetical protein